MADFSVIGAMIGTIVRMIIYIGVAVGAIAGSYFGYKFFQYKYECWIYTKRAKGGVKISVQKGGFFKLTGDAWIFKLRKNRQAKIKPPSNKFIHQAGRKMIIHFRNIGENQYIPFNPEFDDEAEEQHLQNVNYDENLSWYLSVVDLIRDRFDFKTFWDKYGQLTIVALMFVLVIVVIYLSYEFVGEQFGRGESLAKAIQSFVQSQGSNPIGGGAP